MNDGKWRIEITNETFEIEKVAEMGRIMDILVEYKDKYGRFQRRIRE